MRSVDLIPISKGAQSGHGFDIHIHDEGSGFTLVYVSVRIGNKPEQNLQTIGEEVPFGIDIMPAIERQIRIAAETFPNRIIKAKEVWSI
jgi:hypothetical protein